MTNTSEPIISVSGLRGILGQQLTPAVALRYTAALASTLPRGPVVVGRDGRASGQMIADTVRATLVAHGLDPVDLGVAATPTVGVEVRRQQAVAGIQISASHNPKQYNGMKLFGSEGRVLPKPAGEQVLKAYRNQQAAWVDVDALGASRQHEDPHAGHAEQVLATVDVEKIRRRQFKVLLDSNHGAGSLLGRQLLEALNCQITLMGDTPDGQFAHTPEPLAENLTSVSAAIQAGNFDVGFCQDPDADRLAIVDEQGSYIGEELTLALCLMQVLPKQQGTIVTNCATSSLSRQLAEQHGCRLLQSAVGEANVADLMIAEQAIFGGEGNGGPIDPQVGYVRDSFVGMARVLELLATRERTISQLVGELPPLSMVKEKATLDTDRLPDLFDRLTQALPDAEASRPDGLKLQWPDRWLLVRGSNTEPIVRFIAEAPSVDDARSLCQTAADVSQQLA